MLASLKELTLRHNKLSTIASIESLRHCIACLSVLALAGNEVAALPEFEAFARASLPGVTLRE